MISGISFPSTVVIAAHLFKHCWADSCQERLDFDDIDDSRNGLLMFKPFEFAFDNSHICFQYDADTELFNLKILFPELRKMTIMEYIQSESEMEKSTLLKSREDWISELSTVKGIDMASV
jgi:HNH endonuclease